MTHTASDVSNPIGLDGIEFVEYASPEPERLEQLFVQCGFKKLGQHQEKNVQLYRQGSVDFVINKEPGTFAAEFASKHGPSICGLGVRVQDAQKAHILAQERGARSIDVAEDPKSHSFPAIYGIGNSAFYFVDSSNHYSDAFEYFDKDDRPEGLGAQVVDHLTHNVPQGQMEEWCRFYADIFNFQEKRYFDIRGQKTGLQSKVMRSPCGKITIPINEPTEGKSQIQEYLDEYNGSGIQHLALLTPDICSTVASLRDNGVDFLDVPDTYYEMLPERLPNIEEDMSRLRQLKILADGDEQGYLLQIFTKNLIGPIFFEIIQRKNHSGFGEGNFQALFDAIESDQQQRGII